MINIKKNQQKLNKVFKKNQVVLAYLFGSATQGRTGPLSDIDIAVLFSEKVKKSDYFDKELHLASEIGGLFKIDRVDIINLETVGSPLLKHQAVFYGIPIFIKDQKIRFEIENQIMKEYEDTKYLRETAHRVRGERIKRRIFGKLPFSPKQEKYFSKHVYPETSN